MSMIQVHEALATILAKIDPKGVEKIPIGESLGRVLAEDIHARRPNPPLDNSAMDGYALISTDIAQATPEAPVKLEIIEDVAAGALHGGFVAKKKKGGDLGSPPFS